MRGTAAVPTTITSAAKAPGAVDPGRSSRSERAGRMGGGMDRQGRRELGEAIEEGVQARANRAPEAPAGTRCRPRDRGRRPRTSRPPRPGAGTARGGPRARSGRLRPENASGCRGRAAAVRMQRRRSREPAGRSARRYPHAGPRTRRTAAARCRGRPPAALKIKPPATVASPTTVRATAVRVPGSSTVVWISGSPLTQHPTVRGAGREADDSAGIISIDVVLPVLDEAAAIPGVLDAFPAGYPADRGRQRLERRIGS